MDTADYIALDQFLRGKYNIPQGHRSPIVLAHEVPMQPGWATVLVAWEAGNASYVGILDYHPNAEHKYRHSTEPEEWTPNFTLGICPDVWKFTGDAAHVAVLVKFTELLEDYTSTEADNQGQFLEYSPPKLVKSADPRLSADAPPVPTAENVGGEFGELIAR